MATADHLKALIRSHAEGDEERFFITATNHPQILDQALFRKFDSVIEYRLSSKNVAAKVIRFRFVLLDTSQLSYV